MPINACGPGSSAVKRSQMSVPGSIYLRDYRDLTLHGGIDESGHVVLLNVLCGLGTKGITATKFQVESKAYWQCGRLRNVLESIGYTPGNMEVYQALYPALTAALPLPGAAVIDYIAGGGGSGVAAPAVVRVQLQRCADFSRWRPFRLVGDCLTGRNDAPALLLAAEERHPGLVTDQMRSLLQALQAFHQAIDEAESRQRLLILGDHELKLALGLKAGAQQLAYQSTAGNKWSGYFSQLEEGSGGGVRRLLADSGARLQCTDADTLEARLGRLGECWGVVADVGSAAMLAFARAAVAAQGRGSLALDEWSHTRGRLGNYRGLQRGSPGQQRLDLITALNGAWRVLIQRALQQGFYSAQPLPLPAVALAWAGRFQDDSSWATLSAALPSRPIAEGGVLVVRTEVPVLTADAAASQESTASASAGEPFVLIEPAQLRPHVAATRVALRGKKFPTIADGYLTLRAAVRGFQEGGDRAVPGLYSDEARQILWPHGRVWQAIDLARTMAAQPGLMLCPEVLLHGYLRMSHRRWEHLDLKAQLPAANERQELNWGRVQRWFYGATLWDCKPLLVKKFIIYNAPTTGLWPLSLVDGGIAIAEVRLGVRFVAVGGGDDAANLTSVSHLVQLFAKAKVQDQAEASYGDMLAEFGAGLRFEARPYFMVEDRTVEEVEWFSAVKSKSGYYRFPSGLVIDAAAYQAKTDQFIQRKRVYSKFLQFGLGEIWRVHQQALAAGGSSLTPEEYVRNLSLQITPILKDLDRQALPPLIERLLASSIGDLRQILRPYQAEGVAWIYLRLHLGFGVCLADEMGLGKTLQAIALLRTMRSTGKPSLVVMPKTLLYNWRRELGTYGGDLQVMVYGDDEAASPADVWLVTYPRLRMNQEFFSSKEWNVVVLDEAQAIKNSDTQVADSVSKLQARYRLALTGTPVENRAVELWSIINWLNPGYLGRQRDFSAYTVIARSSEQKAALMAPLRESLDPVILRRMKSDPLVALGLPDKVHLDLGCDLSDEQMTLYEAVLEMVLAEDDKGLPAFARSAIYLKAILHLKQICIHPELFYGDQNEAGVVADLDADTAAATKRIRQVVLKRMKQQAKSATFACWIERSRKVSAVYELLQSLRPASRGILIFTQYRGAAAILQRICSATTPGGDQTTVPFIHGGLTSEERLNLVDEFNDSCRLRRDSDPCPVLILSLKAGGTGLNLTEADRVIHFDRWWNPAVEDQASDRAHRIGQKRTVFVHTVTCQATIEEAIGQMFIEKRRLSEDLLGSATTAGVSDLLRSRDGFLDLVDPLRFFSKRLRQTKH